MSRLVLLQALRDEILTAPPILASPDDAAFFSEKRDDYIADIPSDARAKRIASRWKTKRHLAPITLVAEQETFFRDVATALDVYFGPASFVTADGLDWDALADLKLLILSDALAHKLPKGHTIPLFTLPDPTLYAKDPALKRSLWNALCQVIPRVTGKAAFGKEDPQNFSCGTSDHCREARRE